MTAHDLTLLCNGISIGVLVAVIMHFIGEALDDRRDRKLLDETLAKTQADREAAQ